MKITQIDLRLPRPELENTCTDCARLVGPQCQPVEEILAAVSEFVFIKDERFGEEIDSALGLTGRPGRVIDDGNRRLGGKAIASRGPGGITGRVLIPAGTIFPVIFPDGVPQQMVEEYRYVICHEIGHALDFATRQIVPPEELTIAEICTGPFRIKDTAEYHSLLLGFEVAACANSARAFSANMLPDWYERIRRQIEGVLATLRKAGGETRKVSHMVSIKLWDILTEFAKVFATASTNDRIANGCRHWGIGTPWEHVLHRHFAAVRALVGQYPRWSADAMLPVRDVLQTMASDRFGCQFVEGENEDRIVITGN